MYIRLSRLSVKQSIIFLGYSYVRGQIFKVRSKETDRNGVSVYLLEDLKGKKVPFFFYRGQLKKAKNPTDLEFPIERILSRWKRKDGQEMVKVLIHFFCRGKKTVDSLSLSLYLVKPSYFFCLFFSPLSPDYRFAGYTTINVSTAPYL